MAISQAARRAARDKIYKALAELFAIGIKVPNRVLVAVFSGYSCTTTDSFAAGLSDLKEEDVLVTPTAQRGHFALTERGIANKPIVEPPTSNDELHSRLKGVCLNKKRMKKKTPFPDSRRVELMFGVLADGGVHTKAEVAKAGGYTCRTTDALQNFLRRLDTLKFLKSGVGRQNLQLVDSLFLPSQGPNPMESPDSSATKNKGTRAYTKANGLRSPATGINDNITKASSVLGRSEDGSMQSTVGFEAILSYPNTGDCMSWNNLKAGFKGHLFPANAVEAKAAGTIPARAEGDTVVLKSSFESQVHGKKNELEDEEPKHAKSSSSLVDLGGQIVDDYEELCTKVVGV